MHRWLGLVFLCTCLIRASSLDIYSGWNEAIFLNPSHGNSLENLDQSRGTLYVRTALANRTLSFLEELSGASDNLNDVTKLLEKNIGNTLSFGSEFFLSLRFQEERFDWLLGVIDSTDGYFITHSGFGSKGAMESYIQRYQGVLGSLKMGYKRVDFGMNLKLLQQSLTVHNYSIGEMVEMGGIWDYMDNRYTQKAHGIGVDFGINCRVSTDASLGWSLLNVGDMGFDGLVTLPSTANMTYGQSFTVGDYSITMDVAYIDLFNENLTDPLKENIRLSIRSDFLDKRLNLHAGWVYGTLAYGLRYQWPIVFIAFDSYKQKFRELALSRHYQLSLGVHW